MNDKRTGHKKRLRALLATKAYRRSVTPLCRKIFILKGTAGGYLNGALVQKSTSCAGKNLKIIICVGGEEENRHLLMCNKES